MSTNLTTRPDHQVADMTLAEWGRREISIAETEMPGLLALGWAVANAPGSVCATAALAEELDPKIERSPARVASLPALEGELALVCLGRRATRATGND